MRIDVVFACGVVHYIVDLCSHNILKPFMHGSGKIESNEMWLKICDFIHLLISKSLFIC